MLYFGYCQTELMKKEAFEKLVLVCRHQMHQMRFANSKCGKVRKSCNVQKYNVSRISAGSVTVSIVPVSYFDGTCQKRREKKSYICPS